MAGPHFDVVGGKCIDYSILVDENGNVINTGVPLTHTFAQITAPGSSAALATPWRSKHSIFVTIAAINTNVVLRIEGSLDNVSWANLDASGLDTTITANGTYGFVFEGPLAYTRVTVVSESGGVAVTADAKYLGL